MIIAFFLGVVMVIAIVEAFIIFDRDKTIKRLISENSHREYENAALKHDLELAKLSQVSIAYKDYTVYSQK